MSEAQSTWHLYLVETHSGKLYTGITTDVARRFSEHQAGRGAKFFRSDPPVRVVFQQPLGGRAEACRAEWRVKRLRRSQKQALIAHRLSLEAVLADD